MRRLWKRRLVPQCGCTFLHRLKTSKSVTSASGKHNLISLNFFLQDSRPGQPDHNRCLIGSFFQYVSQPADTAGSTSCTSLIVTKRSLECITTQVINHSDSRCSAWGNQRGSGQIREDGKKNPGSSAVTHRTTCSPASSCRS